MIAMKPKSIASLSAAWRDWGPIALWIAAFAIADRWFAVPIVFSAPAAFLGALVYGYFARERSKRRRADLMEEAAAAWEAVEDAARDVGEAESAGAAAAVTARRGEAYAAALDRSAIVARRLTDYDARYGRS
ncbi:putative lipoprotein [Methylocella silvestris BL2]|uniref:Putative lipoprotein n=1 Tax=Methylocella silvestris (strain DSM 15510 / CIP 108128 / LMG 27833 / NCIMB 13906 / BL2) TaxID=395965 RepID=B8EKN8_METSB|nr:hypothetical protein [Methylocella silvestris]ACK51916.1 putative lipoprotein [Methylocella silvestris BL2]